ncbi:MAG: hypothetical protein HN855_01230 [Anaerolineae bacterium]|jgi:hypothetical protein|nr:hypothetical protein [Anaerolineae bacterium]MBT7071058.1 hypothetical protein [Anaerolineae bacterium]MBT7323764.1 hypothetical protein [Anaerolineae bacterium]
MNNKILVIISTSDAGKARTGAMYAVNALKQGWMDDVKIIFFGPAQNLLLVDEELQNRVKEYQEIEEAVVACKFISARDAKSEQLSEIGIQVAYVGEMVSSYIHEGYVPMVW